MFEYYRWNIFSLLNDDLLIDWDLNPPSTFVRLRVSEARSWMSVRALFEVAEEYSIQIPLQEPKSLNT